MQTIQTKYIPATDQKSAKVSALSTNGHRVTVSYDTGLSEVRAHWEAAKKLALKLGWSGTLVAGSISKGYVFVFMDSDDKFTIGAKA